VRGKQVISHLIYYLLLPQPSLRQRGKTSPEKTDRDYELRSRGPAILGINALDSSIVSDRDHVITSTFWSKLFRLSGVQLRMSTAFHPQTDDDHSEVTNRITEFWESTFAA
jgi:hypothetical protein